MDPAFVLVDHEKDVMDLASGDVRHYKFRFKYGRTIELYNMVSLNGFIILFFLSFSTVLNTHLLSQRTV